MGHQVSIIENIPHITPVKSRVEAIVKLDPQRVLRIVNNSVEW